MTPRIAQARLRELLSRFPVVLLQGPRQCGKTTLARALRPAHYLDMERPSDRQVLAGDPEHALSRLESPVVIDEAQALPEVFPVLRALVDEARDRRGRFLLLGSVSQALVAAVSESLAGRVGILALTPFTLAEAGLGGLDVREHWLRGGFPDACRESDPSARFDWFEAYVETFVERDVRQVSARLQPAQLRRLATMLAHYHGSVLNASDLARAMGVSYQTVQSYLDILEGFFLVRRLAPYYANLGKRLVKSPKVYLRDSGLLHHLLGVRRQDDLSVSPKRGDSWEGYVIEQILAREALESPGSRAYFYRTQAGAEIDLLVDREGYRIGFEMKAAGSASPPDWRHLRAALDERLIDHGYVVNLGSRSFSAGPGIDVVSASDMLTRGIGSMLPVPE